MKQFRDILTVILLILAIVLGIAWLAQSGALQALTAVPQVEPVVQQPTPVPEQPAIFFVVPEQATPEPTATPVPVRIQSDEIQSHGHSSTAGGCTVKDTPLGRVTSCVSKDGE